MLHFGSKSSYVTLKEQLHDGNEKPYIPGSTIKGAIRSALFNTLMNKRRNLGEHEISNGNNRATAQGLEKRLFGEDPNHDILRFLRVGDAYFEKGCTISMELNSLNIVKNGSSVEKSTKSAQLVEAITVDELAEFGMDINLDLWESCISKEKVNGKIEGLSSLENLFSLINKNTLSLIEEELSFWDEDLTNDDVLDYKARLEEVLETTVACQNGKSCVLRLGHGMGWSFIVGNWAKNGEIVNDELWEKIKNASRPNNQQYYRDYAFPKTRRVDADMDVLGFVKLTFA